MGLDKLHHFAYTTPMDAIHTTALVTPKTRCAGGSSPAVPATRSTASRLRSSWIASVSYRQGFLVLFLRSGEAIVHGPNVPAWVPGLICAGRVGEKETGRLASGHGSVGRAYNRLVRGKWAGQRVLAEEAQELRRIMS